MDEWQDHRDSEAIEIQLLLEAIHRKYGYDFRDYARSSIVRRIRHRMIAAGLRNISEVQHRLLYDRAFFDKLLLDFSIHVTAMFRDPTFYRALRAEVLPLLRRQPFFKVWHAGCATGEEVYSMAILLQEEGLYDRAQIYATDYNEVIVRQAREGIFPIGRIQEYTRNYQKAGGRDSLASYYTAGAESVIMKQGLKSKIVFADHNLVTDGVFGEMNLILCRNVLIYFNRELQNRVIGLFHESLCEGGILCLGSKESIRISTYSNHFEDLVREEKIYRRTSVAS